MKVAVTLATWNKNECLSNTLYSIKKQIVSFPFELCIVDDCSKIDPEPIIRKFFPDAKYKRLNKQVGFLYANSVCLDLISQDVDIVIAQGADVMLSQPFTYEELVKYTSSKKITLAEVLKIPIDKNFHKKFDSNINKLSKTFGSYNKEEKQQTGRMVLGSWLFFLGAIMRKDMDLIDYRENSCDAVIGTKMKSQGFEATMLSYIKGIHQEHPKSIYSCPLQDVCEYSCSRTSGRSTIRQSRKHAIVRNKM